MRLVEYRLSRYSMKSVTRHYFALVGVGSYIKDSEKTMPRLRPIQMLLVPDQAWINQTKLRYICA